ncbi:MAG: hypothetical protein JWQ32_1530 [Marmoricola sp.]|nr:hypothetical protein [Marmoricola sp.]
MYNILFALHLLTAIFAVGPLVHIVTTASRGLRTADAGATAASARTARLYAYVSVLVVIFGMGVMSSKQDGKTVATFSDPYIWISLLLWLVAMALTLALIVPALQQATTRIGAGEAVDNLSAKVAASGGVVGLIFAVIVFLMVYKPGS